MHFTHTLANSHQEESINAIIFLCLLHILGTCPVNRHDTVYVDEFIDLLIFFHWWRCSKKWFSHSYWPHNLIWSQGGVRLCSETRTRIIWWSLSPGLTTFLLFHLCDSSWLRTRERFMSSESLSLWPVLLWKSYIQWRCANITMRQIVLNNMVHVARESL